MKLSSQTIIGAGNNRKPFDFYPTPANVTQALLDTVQWDKTLRVWEPACGQNHMVDVLKTHFSSVLGTDIQKGEDYLGSVDRDVDAIITNPPFSLAAEFIAKSLKYPYVAMLVKTQYWHSKKRITLFKSRPPSKIIALTWRPQFDQSAEHTSPTMDFIWTVWEPDTVSTEYVIVEKPNG